MDTDTAMKKHSGKLPPWGRAKTAPHTRRHTTQTPRVAVTIVGIGTIQEAFRARYGRAPARQTIEAALYGRTDNETLVRAVAEMFPDAILPAVAARYGIELTPTAPVDAAPQPQEG